MILKTQLTSGCMFGSQIMHTAQVHNSKCTFHKLTHMILKTLKTSGYTFFSPLCWCPLCRHAYTHVTQYFYYDRRQDAYVIRKNCTLRSSCSYVYMSTYTGNTQTAVSHEDVYVVHKFLHSVRFHKSVYTDTHHIILKHYRHHGVCMVYR